MGVKITYRERERQKAIQIKDSLLKDPGNGVFMGKQRDFVLNDPSLNLWEGIREDAQHYFKVNGIPWWKGDDESPTGHLLSSQVACINHLYFLRQRQDLATAVLKGIDENISEAEIVDNGFVEFEFIGSKKFLSEKTWTRGANCTSVDAVMIGRHFKGSRVMFFVEWKYTEHYSNENKYIKERYEIYDPLIKSLDSPFKEVNAEDLYFEPFYQMMRQTLLAWKTIENKDYNCDDYYHIHVIPSENKDLLEKITSPNLTGTTISEAWKSILKAPGKYITISPKDFISPCIKLIDNKSFIAYLDNRYWQQALTKNN